MCVGVRDKSAGQLKRERSAFQGRIPSKDEAANDLIGMKLASNLHFQTFPLFREAAGLAHLDLGGLGGTSRVEPDPRTGNKDKGSHRYGGLLTPFVHRYERKLGHLIIIILMCIRTEYHRLFKIAFLLH